MEEELDEQEESLLNEYCKDAMKRYRHIPTGGMYSEYNSQTEPEKRQIAESLEHKGYLTPAKGSATMITRGLSQKGADYCNKLKKQL